MSGSPDHHFPHLVTGWACVVCGERVGLDETAPWRCPNSTADDRHHVLGVVTDSPGEPSDVAALRSAVWSEAATRSGAAPGSEPSDHPFVAHDHRLAWAAIAAVHGMSHDQRIELVGSLDEAIRRVDGVGFVTTPFERSSVLSERLGFAADGGVWAKDETRGVGGSQKARHLFSILLHLRAMEVLGLSGERPRLAIASCGNAALAAATLARAAEWPIDVYVPTWMSNGFGDRLDALGATTHRCERRVDDPPGDPAMLRFREAVDAGAVPFTVQGPENALSLDGGRTIGWEIADQTIASDGPGRLGAMFVQVGGGAFAACLGAGLVESGVSAPLIAVQTEGCAPFDRALAASTGVDAPGRRWSEIMVPWQDPHSLADGILDDETYDWIGVLGAVRRTGGGSVVASEANVIEAHRLAHEAGFDASPTGASGLAGLLHTGGADGTAGGRFAPTERVGLVISGVTR